MEYTASFANYNARIIVLSCVLQFANTETNVNPSEKKKYGAFD